MARAFDPINTRSAAARPPPPSSNRTDWRAIPFLALDFVPCCNNVCNDTRSNENNNKSIRGLATNRRPRSQRIVLVSPRTAFSPSTLLGFRISIKGFPSACDTTAPRIQSTFNILINVRLFNSAERDKVDEIYFINHRIGGKFLPR